MYLEYFGLSEKPFSITPDPRFIYLGPDHSDAFSHLVYGAEQQGSGGFIVLTGEVGSGKTTLSRLLLDQLGENTRAALLLYPALPSVDLLAALCKELSIECKGPHSIANYIECLNADLLEAYAKGKRTLLIIDEAQNLGHENLELVRMLTNLETDSDKLLQILLLGQPELRDIINAHELRQLRQRITARFHLQALNADDCRQYLNHRTKTAGARRELFTARACKLLHKYSLGLPRSMNILADRALLSAYANGRGTVLASDIRQAQKELLSHSDTSSRFSRYIIPLLLLLLFLIAFFYYEKQHIQTPFITEAAGTSYRSNLNLLQHYGIETRFLSGSCLFQQANNWHCLELKPSRMTLQRLPAGWLASLGSNNKFLLVDSIKNESVEYRKDTGLGSMPYTEFLEHWNGTAIVIWQSDQTLPEILKTGDQTPLLTRIYAFFGLEPESTFTPSLQQAIQSWQIQKGLKADGILGPESYYYLRLDGLNL